MTREMVVMIAGMTMPKTCIECPILQYGWLECYCPLAKDDTDREGALERRMGACPLREIPGGEAG